jgi:hypothetical protein
MDIGENHMGTRSAIGTINNKGEIQAIYKHWDGYPSSTGVDLQRFVRELGGNVDALVEYLLSTYSLSSFGNINLPPLWKDNNYQDKSAINIDCRPDTWAAIQRLIKQDQMGERDFFRGRETEGYYFDQAQEVEKLTKVVKLHITGEPEERKDLLIGIGHEFFPYLLHWYNTGMTAHSQRQFQDQWKDRDLITSVTEMCEMWCEYAYLFNPEKQILSVCDIRYREGLFLMAELKYDEIATWPGMAGLGQFENDDDGHLQEAWERNCPVFALREEPYKD